MWGVLAWLLAVPPAAAQALPAHPERREAIGQAYAHMLGRPPSAAELSAWVYYQDVPPGIIDAARLGRVLAYRLRADAAEREATARRALLAAGLPATAENLARATDALAADPDGGFAALLPRLSPRAPAR